MYIYSTSQQGLQQFKEELTSNAFCMGACQNQHHGLRYPRRVPSTQYLRTLVPKTILCVACGTSVLKYWVLGPSGISPISSSRVLMETILQIWVLPQIHVACFGIYIQPKSSDMVTPCKARVYYELYSCMEPLDLKGNGWRTLKRESQEFSRNVFGIYLPGPFYSYSIPTIFLWFPVWGAISAPFDR